MLRWRLSAWLESRALKKAGATIRQLRAERDHLTDELDYWKQSHQWLQHRLAEQAKDIHWVPAVHIWQRAEAELTAVREMLAASRRQTRLLQGAIYAAHRPQ